MKKVLPFIFCLLLTGIAAHAQPADTAYNKQWKIIDSLITIKNLPKTALARVNKIYDDARRRDMPAQVIKALLYKVNLQDKITEKDINTVNADWDKEITLAKDEVEKSILYVLKAQSLSNYYNNVRWNINGRTKTADFKKEDIATWGADDFYTAISALYTKALKPAFLLQQANVKQYDAIIIKGNIPDVRPTLYDLLANIALDYYKDGSVNKIKPQNAFALNDTMALAPTSQFVSYKFVTADTASRMLKALQLYQQVIKFHLMHNDTAALIVADISRIEWVNTNAAFIGKEQRYNWALKNITEHYPNHRQAAQAWYLMVKIVADKAEHYKPFTDTAYRYNYVIAKQMIEEGLKAQPAESEGNSNLQQLLNNINRKQLQTTAEGVNIPGQPFRMLVQYKNVDTLYGRIISKKLVDAIRGKEDNIFWKEVATLQYSRAFVQPLPATGDYQEHKVEIKMAGLAAGEYVLLGSSTKGFVDSTGKLLTQDITVSHLSYIHNGSDYFVLDRETGKPLKGVKVTVTLSYYVNGNVQKTLPAITTNEHGHFSLPLNNSSHYANVLIALTDGADVLNAKPGDYIVGTASSTDNTLTGSAYEKRYAYVSLFTDRAIYRPGQKVFFKAIASTQDSLTRKPKLYLTGDSLKFYLQDVNGKSVDSIKLKLNEYGSVAGSFVLPTHALTGGFGITSISPAGERSFRVEEYKRPTFYVQLDTLKSAYRLKDTITVTGFAQAFAGNFLNNAQVKYNVQRGTRYNIYDRGFKRFPRTNNNAQIAEGVITTDASGRFTIKFPALADETIDTATSPIFDFTINATVTDAGGETREANTSISVGYASLTVKLNVPAVVEKNSLTKIPVSVENLSGRPVDANVHINIYPLQSPGKPVHKRYWDRPDMFVMSKEEFIENFPYDEYEQESDEHTWQKGTLIVSDTFTSSHAAYSLEHNALAQGWYAIEATTVDKDGHEIKDVAYFEVYDASSAAVPAKDDHFNIAEKTVLHPGDKTSITVGSAFDNVFIIQQIDKPLAKGAKINAAAAFQFYTINNGKKQIEEPVREDDRGGFGITYAFVKHNRFYTSTYTFTVPYDNKELNVKYATYRNKTEPGSKEQWTVQVTGNDSTKKAAELLTAMYDASLDQFVQHAWDGPNRWPLYYGNNNWKGNAFNTGGSTENGNNSDYFGDWYQLDRLATQGENLWNKEYLVSVMGNYIKGAVSTDYMAAPPMARLQEPSFYNEANTPKHMKIPAPTLPDADGDGVTDQFDIEPNTPEGLAVDSHGRSTGAGKAIIAPPPQLRTNFNETAFFFPQLTPDSAGNYTIQFTMPESLTKWKWMSLAHTKDLAFGSNEATIITQKTLMVQPNVPRFLREGDHLELTARISNTGDTALTGQVELQLLDAETNTPVDGLFQNVFPNQYFTSEAGQTSVVKFPVVIPFNYNKPLTYRMVAKTTAFNDGEENTLPVLTNRMLVTESLPLYIKGDTAKQFTFDKLLNNNSETLQTQSLTVEYTVNPIWNAVQALPYLMEYPYECAEQTFNRFYANVLASYIIQQHPRIKEVFQKWAADSSVLVSNLAKNEELKQILLAETPWVLDAQNETQQRKNIALLFDMVKMADGAKAALQKLQDMQMDNGSFPWFKGGYADRYITQYILTGIGRLQELKAVPADNATALNAIVSKALVYLDNETNKDYDNLVKYKADLSKDNLSNTAIQYLFMRSYFSTVAIGNKKAYNYFYQQAMKYWQPQSVYMQGMIALTLLRTSQQAFVQRSIYPAILENAVTTPDKGMYWKNNQWGYYWYQSPIEQQALLIELAEALQKHTDADEMKTWLINQKQTTNWKTTKATADACFALLLHSDAQLDADRKVTIQLGGYTISSDKTENVAGTGYFKTVITGDKVAPAMGNVTVNVSTPGGAKNTSPSYGAVYWQYLEDMDKITQATTSLSLHKQLFIENNTAAGKVLTPVTDDSVLHVGDKVVVRMVLKTDRNLEYIHLKDMRAASMEPVNVLSEYKYQDGLGYYESTKDVATDFFISYMAKGTYVFEYPVYITHTGTFSAGIATIQCMYAPEFTSHSEGLKVVVEGH